MIERILETFCNVLRVTIGILVFLLVIPVFMQVLARYTGIIPVYLWTEELATFLFIWIVMIGSMIAVWEGTHFDVHVTPEATSPFGILLQKGVVLVMIAIFALLFAYYGIDYAVFGFAQTAIMMPVNMLTIYITVPLAGFGWLFFSLFRLWQLVLTYRATTAKVSA